MPRVLNVLVPLLAAAAWIATLITLLVLWLANGRQRYKPSAPHIAFISNIGGYFDEVFIVGAAITNAFFVATLFLFIFRHRRLQRKYASNPVAQGQPPTQRLFFDLLALVTGIISAACLVLLAIYDSKNHETAHWIFTLVFAFAAILCAIFNLISVAAFRKLRRLIHVTYAMKLFFIIAATCVLITMIGLMYSCSGTTPSGSLTPHCDNIRSIAAILEWSLALLFFIFLLTWVVDGLA